MKIDPVRKGLLKGLGGGPRPHPSGLTPIPKTGEKRYERSAAEVLHLVPPRRSSVG